MLAICSCSTAEKITIEDTTYKIYRPPGTVKISDQFYADEAELTNIDYKEFMYWTKAVFGEDSETYQELLPDTSVWLNNNKTTKLATTYYQHPSYDYYPAVGISYEQATKYTKWRTDRVAEMILVMNKAVVADPHQTKDNYFTIEKYASGKYQGILKKENILLPKYKIPSKAEWELIAGNAEEVAKTTYPKTKKKHAKNSTTNSAVTMPSRTYLPNNYGLYGITGNVSEIIEDPTICKGGNWNQAHENVQNDIPFEAPNSTTGFRNVATLELVKVR